MRGSQAGRLHFGVDAHIADGLGLGRVGRDVVVCAERAREGLADVGGAEGDGEVEDGTEEEGIRVGCVRRLVRETGREGAC